MKRYNWQQHDWPNFRYELTSIMEVLLSIAEKTGQISGKLSHLPEHEKTETLIDLMVEEAIKTSQIEGEHLNRPDVRSSIKNKLGIHPSTPVHDRRSEGIAELMINSRNTFNKTLTEEQLFNWHLMLFAGSKNPNLRIGYWRTDEEPMQIVSGYSGKHIVHFEAPPAERIPQEMKKFIRWFNQSAPGKSQALPYAPVRAAIAHLYFESIHPFEDGNGRIGRVIAEKALSQGLGYPVLLSLSQSIEANKKVYYNALSTGSTSNEITPWIDYFVHVILEAQNQVEAQINFILKKANFFNRYQHQLNQRELKAIQRMLKAGIKGFEGGMSARKYMIITDTSKATATRDLQHLVEIGAFKQIGSGRSVRYELTI